MSEQELPPEEATASQETEEAAETVQEDGLQQLHDQIADYKEKYLRGLADSENMRKRLQKERHDLVQYAVQDAIIDFLPPIDHLESALKFADQAPPEVQHWAIGFHMILNQFKEALANNGVSPFVSKGEAFDPHLHEALEMVTTDEAPPGTVVEELLTGYRMKDKIIRVARVKVSASPNAEELELPL